MDQKQLMSKLLEMIDTVKTGILSSVDDQGMPRMRWMTPCILSYDQSLIYAVTSPYSVKAEQMKKHPQVEWMFQSKSLDKIINVTGKMNLIDNPSLKNEILETVSPRLSVFWKVVGDKTDFFITETIIESATYFEPVKGYKVEIKFK